MKPTDFNDLSTEPSDFSEEAFTAEEFSRRNELARENSPNDFRRGAMKGINFAIDALLELYAYDGNRHMAFDCLLVALGQGVRIGLESAVEISKKYCSDDSQKATATKCIQYFQKRLGIPPMPGQRDTSGRKAMSIGRKEQLTK